MEKRCKGLVELDGPIIEVFVLFEENRSQNRTPRNGYNFNKNGEFVYLFWIRWRPIKNVLL